MFRDVGHALLTVCLCYITPDNYNRNDNTMMTVLGNTVPIAGTKTTSRPGGLGTVFPLGERMTVIAIKMTTTIITMHNEDIDNNTDDKCDNE